MSIVSYMCETATSRCFCSSILLFYILHSSKIKRGKESGEFQFMSSTTAKFRSLLGRSRAKDVTQMGAFRSLSYTSYCYKTRGDVVNLVRCLVELKVTCWNKVPDSRDTFIYKPAATETSQCVYYIVQEAKAVICKLLYKRGQNSPTCAIYPLITASIQLYRWVHFIWY